jgi:N-acetylneuraminic acid mutarotase
MTPALASRYNHTAVWADTRMIVWGGIGSVFLNDGGLYDPVQNNWTYTPNLTAPFARENHTAVWTGKTMVIWGGYNGIALPDGGAYNPQLNTWSQITTNNGPSARFGHTAVWDDYKGYMIIWGGTDGGGGYDIGSSLFIPNSNTWVPMSTLNAPPGRLNHTAVWDGTEMIIWGGSDAAGKPLNVGGRYDPLLDSWTATTTVQAPLKRASHVALWTGKQMFIWGGASIVPPSSSISYLNDTYMYNPVLSLFYYIPN